MRASDPKKLAFFTGRDQSQSLTSLWATSFGTPNWAAHGGFCSVNMAAAGQYTVGGSFWEFGEPDWEHAGYFLLFGVAEDHDSNPIKLGLSRLKARGAKIVAINPVRTGYAAIADEWLGIRPGTDGLFILALVHELLRLGRVDLDYLARLTDAGWLVVDAPGTATMGSTPATSRAATSSSTRRRRVMPAEAAARPRLGGGPTLPDGRRATPVFAFLAERYRRPDYAPEAVAERCGIAGRDDPRGSRPRSAMWRSSGRSSSTSPGPTPTAGAMPASSAGRWRCTPCAASRPTPTASRPAARCTCCSS